MQPLIATSMLAGNMDTIYARLVQYLAEHTQLPMVYDAPPNWGPREQQFDNGSANFGMMCGWPYVRKSAQLELLAAPVMGAARYGGQPVYFSDVIVRTDSPIHNFADLRGKRWVFNERLSFSGHAIVCAHLNHIGETHAYFGSATPVGSHANAILAVLAGDADAAAIDSTVLERAITLDPTLVTKLRSVAALGPSSIPPMVLQQALPQAQKVTLRAAIIAMHEDDAGRALLAEAGITRYVAVNDADYADICHKARTTDWVTLSAAECERGFAQPQHTAADLATLAHMRSHLQAKLPDLDNPGTFNCTEANGKAHRVIVVDPHMLRSGQPLTVVGFFGQRNWLCGDDVIQDVIRTDADLVRSLFDYAHAVSYSSLELSDGNWGNLVILNAPDGIAKWREGSHHQHAAETLSPQYYSTIRLHHGEMPNGLASPIRHIRSKFYDFRRAAQ